MTAVVLAAGWRLWVGERLLVEGERLDELLEDYALAEMVRAGRAVPVHDDQNGSERKVTAA